MPFAIEVKHVANAQRSDIEEALTDLVSSHVAFARPLGLLRIFAVLLRGVAFRIGNEHTKWQVNLVCCEPDEPEHRDEAAGGADAGDDMMDEMMGDDDAGDSSDDLMDEMMEDDGGGGSAKGDEKKDDALKEPSVDDF